MTLVMFSMLLELQIMPMFFYIDPSDDIFFNEFVFQSVKCQKMMKM